MPWQTFVGPRIDTPATGGWVNVVLPVSIAGVISWGADYVPDKPTPAKWSRLGWVAPVVIIEGTQLTGPIETLPGVSAGGNTMPVMLNYRFLDAYAGLEARVAEYRFYMQVVPFAPPGNIRLWALS